MVEELAPGVAWLTVSIANVYFVGDRGGPWLLVDTGVAWNADKIRTAAEKRFGPGARPAAIVLTHGHTDHAGSAFDLAVAWEVPVYVHRLEMPFLTGNTTYPPTDPTVGGLLAFLSRFFPPACQDLRPRLQELPPDGELPALPDWKWLPTPGHAPGHVSLYRESDGILLAGDAFATVNMDSLVALATKRQEIAGPPAPATCDWLAARQSVQRLADLRPTAFGCGHGVPWRGPEAAAQLAAFAADFPMPHHGRYVVEPARTDANGTVSLPPPAPDPLLKQIGLGAGLLAVILGALFLARRKR